MGLDKYLFEHLSVIDKYCSRIYAYRIFGVPISFALIIGNLIFLWALLSFFGIIDFNISTKIWGSELDICNTKLITSMTLPFLILNYLWEQRVKKKSIVLTKEWIDYNISGAGSWNRKDHDIVEYFDLVDYCESLKPGYSELISESNTE